MEELNGITIYWLISIGLIIGFFIELIFGKRGMNLTGNLIGGVIGSVVIGICSIWLELYGALLYATVGAVAFLFLVNVFSMDPAHTQDTKLAK